jgi:lipoprotein-anchoring transpeptidase ErfK/SrfK
MPRLYSIRLVLATAAFLLAQLVTQSSAMATDHGKTVDTNGPTTATNVPVPPAIGPRLAPPPFEGFHPETIFPTPTEKWIDVDLSEQRVVAYEGSRAVREFIVSTGLPGTPTVQGTFRIWIKTRMQDMSGGSKEAGDYYYLEDVEWVQYFYDEYAFHGAYWHNSFGRPMSRGCINMRNEDARWLFEWATPSYNFDGPLWQKPTNENPGTLVVVHE